MRNLIKLTPLVFWGLVAIFGVVAAQSITAAEADSTWGEAFTEIYGWVSGGLGDLIALAAFIIGAVTAVVVSQGKAVALGAGVVVALAIKVGPAIYLSIAGASLHVSSQAMWFLG